MLIIPAAIDNIKNRDDANNFINNDAGIVSLDKFITSSKAHRFRLYNTNEIYMRTIDVRYNQKPVSYTHLDVYKRQGYGILIHTSEFLCLMIE